MKGNNLIKRVLAALAPVFAVIFMIMPQAGASPTPVIYGTPQAQHYALSFTKQPDRIYVVRHNDTLSKIGKKYHIRWQSLFCANRKKLHNQTDLIYPGQKLVLRKTHCKLPAIQDVTTASPVRQKNNPVSIPQGSAQQIAQALLNAKGWGSQFGCLDSIIMRESGWNVTATNPYSGAYGIPQALPGSKMSIAGADWQTSAYTQLKWMIDYYIGPSYGSPCGAWEHELATGTY